MEPWETLSWQSKVWHELFPSDTQPYQTAGAGIPTVPIYFGVFGDYISLSRYSQPVALAGDTPAVSFSNQLAPGDEGGLFNTMAAASGGYVALIDDQASIPTTSRFDVNGDFVVDIFDYNLVIANSGLGCQ